MKKCFTINQMRKREEFIKIYNSNIINILEKYSKKIVVLELIDTFIVINQKIYTTKEQQKNGHKSHLKMLLILLKLWKMMFLQKLVVFQKIVILWMKSIIENRLFMI